MKSAAQQLLEAIDQLEKAGKTAFVKSIQDAAKTKSIEQRLMLCHHELGLRESNPVRKHNGVSDNKGVAATEADQAKARQERLVESFKLLGLSQREAEVAAGVSHEDDLREAIRNGSNAHDFWEAIKNFKE